MAQVGTADNPLRVAIIGSGPSGFYTAAELLEHKELVVQVDVIDRLPTPFGLVRLGVAPDHQKIKSVTKIYDKIATHPEFRFYGNVDMGVDVTHADLSPYYHAIIYATGAPLARRLGVPGEHLPGSRSATAAVAWYNGHPDFTKLSLDLTHERAVVVGNGNVAMDVARVFGAPPEYLATTDIADHALEALRASSIREVVVVGRRGPAQAAFTPKELKELGEIPGLDVIVDPADLELDAASKAALEGPGSRNRATNVAVLQHYADRGPTGAERRVVFRFLLSPVEIVGTEAVKGVVMAHNELYHHTDGSHRARQTDVVETIEAGAVFRAIGYHGAPLPGVPFDARGGVIPNQAGRVTHMSTDEPLEGEYAVGWIKRGPQGVIGTNKTDAQETVTCLLDDLAAGRLDKPGVPSRAVLERLLKERREDVVTFEDWKKIDEIERAKGEAQGRPRVKFTNVDETTKAARSQD
jgi:ferredoxin/flavodoxin---NADP+ reductase